MFALRIGWNTYYFESAEAAARVMTLLQGAQCIDTLYVDALKKNVHYYKQSPVTLEAVETPDKLLPNYDAAVAFRDECNAPPVTTSLKDAPILGGETDISPDFPGFLP